MDSSTYTASSRLQASGLASAIGLFEQAARTAPLPRPPQPITIADYGAANGHNSLPPLNAAIGALRGRTRGDRAILVAHTDLPDNDFTALFTTLRDDPDSYLKTDSATFASAVGGSFYQQILPSQSVTLGWSSWATHWLSRAPALIPDHIHISHSTDESACRAFARQGATDWQDFLASRGRELAPGGRLVVLALGIDSAGKAGFAGVMQAILESLHALVDRGSLQPEELQRMAVPTIGRTKSDFLEPFSPSGVFDDLSVEHLEPVDAEDRFWSRYRTDGDAVALGADWAGFARAAMFPSLLAALEAGTADRRTPEFVDGLTAQVAHRIAASPQPNSIPLAAMVFAKAAR